MALFEGLTTLHPETLEPVPGAASSWEVSEDGLTYTFHIRPGLAWSDGSPLSAHDFLYSWKRFLTIAPYSYLLWHVRGGKDFGAGRLDHEGKLGIEAPDDTTFIVRLASPCPYFVNLVSFYPLCPVSRACIERHGTADWIKPENIVTNGPFRIRERRLKDRIRLERNPFYWDRGSVGLETIDALAVDSPITALNLYLTGAVDWINVVPPIAIPVLRDRPDFSATINLGTNFLRFNTTRPPLDDVRVRRAIHLALDKEELVEGVLKGGQVPAASFVPPDIPGYTPPAGESFDPELARELLTEAGFAGGEGFPGFSLLYSTGETARDIAEVIGMQLKRNLGIRIHPASQERKVYYLSQSSLDYDICLANWLGDYLDPSTFLDVFTSESGNNRTGWKNADYDALVRRAGVEIDPRERERLLVRAEEILLGEAPIALLYFRSTTNMIDPSWKGYANNILDVHPLKYLEREAP
jgi:oligopeptide transport system substrate-binding protein